MGQVNDLSYDYLTTRIFLDGFLCCLKAPFMAVLLYFHVQGEAAVPKTALMASR